ncbi:CDP-diacylglycerol--glycerol-3-phosphate 3-phosphatidyltransferase [Mycoplasma sp. 'Moose RK']|uniref:CDP-diacylglycerol--glycerol-3-phosphate 3-phosphatidyltransferase n=1 Tax=Mycoplasma sp. 'Moose RK' TaxID=2780095 RepID=UPI0018C24DBE|nr:CDP-diacylglycerol--glycerol-3-phosphate 3-phosphatidyltransferase [Mycoplasma sp. 'Moose RK']MBG0730721.1 CDP-diacylglycerol--glycerol-3-phosphate 3-phosphatidyltransferase [Mycoplasma sp. 'Moose RK']
MKKKLDSAVKLKSFFVNFLSLSRIFCALVIGILTYFFANSNSQNFSLFFAAFAIFICASLTDWLDGFLARKWKVVTDFGQVFDPITDKVLTTTTFFCLAFLKLTPWFLVSIFILRDIIVDGLRIFLAKRNIKIAANFWGKAKTVAQILAITLIFASYSIDPKIFLDHYYYFNISVIIAAILSLFSGLTYLIPTLKLIF